MSLAPCYRDTGQTGHLSRRMRSRVVGPMLQGHWSDSSSQSEDEVSCRWSLGMNLNLLSRMDSPSVTPCCRDTHRQTGHLSLRMRSRVVDPVLQGHSSSNWSSQSEDEVSCR